MSSWHVHGAPSLFKMLKISKSYQLHKKIEDPVLVALAITWQFQILKLDKETEETLEDIRLPRWQVFKLGEGYLECVASKSRPIQSVLKGFLVRQAFPLVLIVLHFACHRLLHFHLFLKAAPHFFHLFPWIGILGNARDLHDFI